MRLVSDRAIWITVVLAGLVLSACAGGAAEPTEAPAATAAPDAESLEGVQVSTAETALGTILVGPQGLSLYMLTADSMDESVCTGACAQAWPPLTTDGSATAGSGAEAALLGSIARPDGTTQVTYDGHPLYTFQGDQAPGDVEGQGIESFGGTWWVLSPSGEPIRGEASSGSAEGGFDY